LLLPVETGAATGFATGTGLATGFATGRGTGAGGTGPEEQLVATVKRLETA
jgi:hypothetical protein